MKNYVKEYKGFQVPKGATHYGNSNPAAYFYKFNTVNIPFFYLNQEWKRSSACDVYIKDNLIELPEAQQEWSGEGSPPVGTICKIAKSTKWLKISHTEGMEVEIYTHFTTGRGVSLASFVSVDGKEGGVATAECFRPLKTQQEKDREAFIARCVSLTELDGSMAVEGFGIAYDDGARFTEPKAGE